MKKFSIVVVENDEDEQMFIKEAFDEHGGIEVMAMLNDGNELFAWLEEQAAQPPHMILSDLNMPGKNGYDIIQWISGHEKWSSIPVVIMSTSSTPSIINKCRAMGATDYLVKPDVLFKYQALIDTLYGRLESAPQ